MSQATPKYENLIQLAEAFRTGELSRDHYTLILDNDDSHLRYTAPLPDGVDPESEAADAWMDEQYQKCQSLFRGNGYSDLDDACTAAGIPCEWC